MCKQINKEINKTDSIIVTQNNVTEENVQRDMNYNPQNAPVQKERLEDERDKAINLIKEELKMESFFNVGVKSQAIKESEEKVEQINEKINKIKELEDIQSHYEEFQKNYFEDGQNSDIEKEILYGYMNNKYGDIKGKIDEIKQSEENIKQDINEDVKSIEERIKQYKENIGNTAQARREAVNNEFEKGEIVKSSKGKKRKGRKKGLLLQGKVIGATEETAAMSYDMQHRKKKIDKWYKNPSAVVNEEVDVTGNEFELVFKNKSGSSMDIKTVMEKIALLDIKIKSMAEDSPQKHDYIKKHEVLSKTLKIVCAANGIDSETGTFFVQETEEQKLDVQKKVDYANSVYKETLEEYKLAIRFGDDRAPEGNEEVNKDKVDNKNKKFTKEDLLKERMEASQYERADMAIFLGAVNKLRIQNKDSDVDDKLWNKAFILCDSYKSELHKDIYERKEAVKKDTKFLSDLISGNNADVLEVVGAKLKELESKGITIQSAFDIEAIKANMQDYKKLASVIELIQYVRAKSEDKKDFDKFMSQDETYAKYNNIAEISLIDNYSDYLNKVATFDKLNDREQKVIMYKSMKMKEKLYSAHLQFEMKWADKDLSLVSFDEMSKFNEEMDDEYRKAEMEPAYTEAINELREYIGGLEEGMQQLEENVAKYEELNKVSDAIKEYITGKMLEDKYFARIKALEAMKKIDRSSLSNTLKPQYTSKAKDLVNDVKKIMSDCEKETLVINEIGNLLASPVYNEKLVAESIEKIKGVFKDSDVEKFYKAYLSEVKNNNKKLNDRKGKGAEELNKEREKLVKEKEKEDELNTCKLKLLSLYSIPTFSEELWEDYYNAYSSYEIKYNKKSEKDLIKNKAKLKEEYTNKYYAIQDAPNELTKFREEMIAGWSVASNKLEQFDKDNSEDIEKLELEAKEKDAQSFKNFLNNLKVSREEHKEKRVNKFVEYEQKLYEVEKDQQVGKGKTRVYGGLTKDEILQNITDSQMEMYIQERNVVVYETYANILAMTNNAYMNFQTEIDNYKEVFKEDDLNKYFDLDKLKELVNQFELNKTGEPSDAQLKNKLIDGCLVNAEINKVKYKELKAERDKLKNTLEDAKNVLNEEMKDVEDRYTDEAKEKSYIERCQKTKNFFTRIKRNFIDKAVDYAKSYLSEETEQKGSINKLNLRFDAYKERVDKLLKEKEIVEGTVNYLGITYNTLAIQDILLNTDKNRYKKIEESFGPKHKEEKDFELTAKDFEAAEVDGKYTTVNFEKLMYKRHKLMEWIEFHSENEIKNYEGMFVLQRIKESFLNKDQQEYYERKEMLEKINKFLKLYSEANGVDFETGELLCEKKGLTKEEVKDRVISSSKYLDETLEDIQENDIKKKKDDDEEEPTDLATLCGYFSKKLKERAEEFQKKLEKKTGKLNEEDEEEDEEEFSLSTEIYSVKYEKESTQLVNETKKRTAHTVVNVKTKVAECKLSAKAAVAAGHMAADKEKQTGNQYGAGVNLEAEAAFTALSNEFLLKYSNKFLGANVEAYAKGKVEVGHAKANAKLAMGLKSEEGKISPHLSMEAGLELALLKLEGSVGAKVLGVGVEAQLAFIAGLVAKGNVKFDNWKLEIDLQVALGIGAGIKLTFDFGELKDKIVNMAKETGAKVVDVLCEKLCRWGFYDQREMWYNIIQKEIMETFKEGEGLMSSDQLKTT